MKEQLLPPIKEEPSDFDELEEIIRKLFRDEIFLPLAKELKSTLVLKNEKISDLAQAIRDNKIYFSHGKFMGKFNSKISKELKKIGAKFDKRTGAFHIRSIDIPHSIRYEIDASLYRFEEKIDKINKTIQQILPEKIAEKLKVEKFFDGLLYKTDAKIKSNIDRITVSPILTPEARAKIASEYTQNMQKYIQTFAEEEIVTLRQFVQEKIADGGRYESLIDLIQKRYEVSANKAKFLARQESGLLMAKFQESRYKSAGVNEYIWRTVVGSKNHPVRPMHKTLDGKRFRFDNPPITDAKGNRNNPGEDYNCRCFAVPIVKF